MAFVLSAAGATRSMQFTAVNTLTFADVSQEQRASASTLSSMVQQVAMAFGIAAAALLLILSQTARGAQSVNAGDFQLAFFVCGGCALAGSLLMLRLAPDAGAEVSGHTPPVTKSAD
jgi:hypothetical protein